MMLKWLKVGWWRLVGVSHLNRVRSVAYLIAEHANQIPRLKNMPQRRDGYFKRQLGIEPEGFRARGGDHDID
jgi:hypothetical protein